jgi:hypothetical protein
MLLGMLISRFLSSLRGMDFESLITKRGRGEFGVCRKWEGKG